MAHFTRVNFKGQAITYLPENEALMSFVDDERAYAFLEWWDRKGAELFNEWLKDSICWSHLAEYKEDK